MAEVRTKSSTGWETAVKLYPEESSGADMQVQVSARSHTGFALVFLSRKQALRHFQRAVALIQQAHPFRLVRLKPDPGFSIAYTVFNKKGRQVGVIEREADGSKCWWVRVGRNEHQEGTGFGVRWAALKFLETKKI